LQNLNVLTWLLVITAVIRYENDGSSFACGWLMESSSRWWLCRHQYLAKALTCPVSCRYVFTTRRWALLGTRASLVTRWAASLSVR